MMPKISVIMPAYNAENTIRQTLDSVLQQTFQDFEIIVVNDGSTDSTLAILEAIQDERVSVISTPNQGPSTARNRGIAQAKGEFIAFIDADDLWGAQKLEAQVQALQAKPEAALAYCETAWIDVYGQPLNKGVKGGYEGDVFKKLLQYNFIANGSNPMLRKDVFAQVGVFDETLAWGEDWDMWLRVSEYYHFVIVRRPLVLHRRSNQSQCANLFRLALESRLVVDRAYQRAPESWQHLKKQTLIKLYRYLRNKALTTLPGPKPALTERQRGLAAAWFFCYTVRYNPACLCDKKFIFPILKQIATMILRPSK